MHQAKAFRTSHRCVLGYRHTYLPTIMKKHFLNIKIFGTSPVTLGQVDIGLKQKRLASSNVAPSPSMIFHFFSLFE